MKKISAMLLLLLASYALADSDKLFLWKVQTEASTVYLLGSLHFAMKEMYPLDPAIEKSFNESGNLVVEVNINEANPLFLLQQMFALARYPEGLTLDQQISGETYELAASKFKEIGMDIAAFQQFEPWFVAMIAVTAKLGQLGLDPSLGVDKHFLDQAEEAGKAVLELESAEFQLKLLDGFTRKEQEDFLAYTMADLDNTEQQVDNMIQSWKRGDANGLEKILTRSLVEQPSFRGVYDRFITDRNVTMTEKIDGYLRKGGTYFVVVGSGHLVGKQGIVDLLKAKGYNAQQL